MRAPRSRRFPRETAGQRPWSRCGKPGFRTRRFRPSVSPRLAGRRCRRASEEREWLWAGRPVPARVRSKQPDRSKPNLAAGTQEPARVPPPVGIHTAACRVGQELSAQAHAQHRLLLRENSTQQLDFADKKWIAGIARVRDTHRAAHHDQHIVCFQGRSARASPDRGAGCPPLAHVPRRGPRWCLVLRGRGAGE